MTAVGVGPAPLRYDVNALRLHAGGRRSGRVLVDGLSLVLRAGERWVVLGPNGAGKSSLLGALAGVFPVAGGSLRLQERALGAWRGDELAAWRAWAPQFWCDPFAATVRETAALAQDRRAWWQPAAADATAPARLAVNRMLERLDLTGIADADVRQLSGGERQRVALATALLQGAPLLLLDEPSAHLDLAHQLMLREVLVDHARSGGAVVASLHDLNQAWALATHVVLIDRGRATAGPRLEVMQPEALSLAYGVAVEVVTVDGDRHFRVAPRRGAVHP